MRSLTYWAIGLICVSSGVLADIGRLSEDELQFSSASAYNRVFNAMKIGGAHGDLEDFAVDLPQVTSIIEQPAVYVPPIKPIAPPFPAFKAAPKLVEPKVIVAGAAGLARGYDPNPPSYFFETEQAVATESQGDADDLLGHPKPIIYEKRWKLARRRDVPGSLWSSKLDAQRKIDGYLYSFGGEEDPRILVEGSGVNIRQLASKGETDLIGTLSLQLMGAPSAPSASPEALYGVLQAFREAAGSLESTASRSLAEKIGNVLQFRAEQVEFQRGELEANPREFGHLRGFEERLACLAKPGCEYEDELLRDQAGEGENAHLAAGFFSQIYADSGNISDAQMNNAQSSGSAHLAASNAAFEETLAGLCASASAAPAQLGCALARARALAAGQFTRTDDRTMNFVQRLLREWETRPADFESRLDDAIRVLAGVRPVDAAIKFPAADALPSDIFAADIKLRQMMENDPRAQHLAAEFAEFAESRIAHDGFLDNIFGSFGSKPQVANPLPGYGSQPLTSGFPSGLGTFIGSGLGSSIGGNLGYDLAGPLGGLLGSAAGASLGSGGVAPLLPTLGASAGGALGAKLGGGGLTSALTGALGQTLGSGGTYSLGNTLGAALGSQLGGGPGTPLGTLGGILGAGLGSSLLGGGGRGLFGNLFGQRANPQPFDNQFPYASAELQQPGLFGRLGSLFSRNLEERQMVDRYLEHLADQFVEANNSK